MSVNGFHEQLSAGDRRSIGRVPQVVRQAFEQPAVRARVSRLLAFLKRRPKDEA